MKFLLFLSLLTQFAITNAQDQWALAKDKDRIQIFTRKLDHQKVKEFKAITYTSKTVDELERILDDVQHYPNWVYSVSKGKLIDKKGNNRTLYYSLDLPWPVSDRDLVIQSIKTKDNGLRYDMTAIQGKIDEKSGFVRMVNAYGSWQFIPEKDKVKIVYQFYGDPAGSIPAWMINMMLVDGPFETLMKLR